LLKNIQQIWEEIAGRKKPKKNEGVAKLALEAKLELCNALKWESFEGFPIFHLKKH